MTRAENPAPLGSASAPNATRTANHLRRVRERMGDLRETLHRLVSASPVLTWEVGCGHGHFLTAYAAAHPEQPCIGIDIARDRIERATRKRNRARLPQLHFVLAEAGEFLAALPENARFSTIFVLFPDPWPKRRHHKNRLMQRGFLDAIALRAAQGARIYFRTDFEPYFLEAAALVRAHEAWEIADEPWPFESQTVFQARAPRYFSLIARKRHERGA